MPPSRPGAKLTVFLGGEEVGALIRRGPARYRFAYGEGAHSAHPEGEAVLSASLRLRANPFGPGESAPFFEGLLPEGVIRRAIAAKFGLSEEDGFGLLEELGADCAGAVVVVGDGERLHRHSEYGERLLSDEELEAKIEDLPRHPLGVSASPDGLRLSLGGVQDKLVLIRTPSGEFAEPIDGAPSNCLIKPESGRYDEIVANEDFCMRVAAAVGLPVAATEVASVGATPCLYVRRFDRETDAENRVVRVHQEDMCQALGILPAAKYEESGGPSVAAIVGLLRSLGTAHAARDINLFVKAVLLNFLLGNSDAHGKNFALLHGETGIRLAPLYDVVSTAAYDDVTDRLAMAIGGENDPARVNLAAWDRLAAESSLGRQLVGFVRGWALDVLAGAEGLRDRERAEGKHRPVIEKIVDVCRARARRLLDER
ncbi:MAG TPA: type II toxin-antitoxin system HipA family toxin [Solirubrobacterales bacterium]|nr:type II toxin-antitoxin system HipA family toxin [Solirubrobacterales bacterium]